LVFFLLDASEVGASAKKSIRLRIRVN